MFAFVPGDDGARIQPITRSEIHQLTGRDNLPYVQLAAGVLIGIIVQVYSRSVRRLPRWAIVPVTQAGEVALLVLFWFLFRQDMEWVSAAFYVLGLMLGILTISQFWTLANDIYEPRQAKRLFGFIGGGASLGGRRARPHLFQGRRNRHRQPAARKRVDSRDMPRRHRDRATENVGDFEAMGAKGVGGEQALRLLRRSASAEPVIAVRPSAP
jgi:hypothetical protein